MRLMSLKACSLRLLVDRKAIKMKISKKSVTETEAKNELENGMPRAEKVLQDADKIEKLLEKLNLKKIE